jgi:hypothetical protein
VASDFNLPQMTQMDADFFVQKTFVTYCENLRDLRELKFYSDRTFDPLETGSSNTLAVSDLVHI